MSKRKRRTPDRRLPRQSHRRLIIVAASVAVFLLSSIGLLAARRRATTRTMVQSGPTDPAHPSKEYIYAGGRMVATEEPAQTSTPPNYTGFLEVADCNSIGGWAADRNRLNVSINVEFYDGSNLIAIVPAFRSRSDVATFLGDNGLHGFTLPTPAALLDGASHTIHVKFETSSTELTGSPSAPINCSVLTPNYVGFVDTMTCNTIGGWAADRSRLNQPISVSIYDGNTLIITLKAGQVRNDVGTFLGDNGLHGFSTVTPPALLTGTTHTIHVKFETGATELTGGSPASLTCP
ncbi:MAG TPA: hypothetical protein VJX67_10730 [Blastocatellia bacterium]|nr:hypothetical protein [Blastocatellia bacterium]